MKVNLRFNFTRLSLLFLGYSLESNRHSCIKTITLRSRNEDKIRIIILSSNKVSCLSEYSATFNTKSHKMFVSKILNKEQALL
jgi:hypothetical protein